MKDLGVRVLGVSRDSVEEQAKFVEKCELKFPLLSDADGSTTEKYDAGIADRPLSSRVTFLIDSKGVVRLRDGEVRVKTHGADMVAAIKRLQEE